MVFVGHYDSGEAPHRVILIPYNVAVNIARQRGLSEDHVVFRFGMVPQRIGHSHGIGEDLVVIGIFICHLLPRIVGR